MSMIVKEIFEKGHLKELYLYILHVLGGQHNNHLFQSVLNLLHMSL